TSGCQRSQAGRPPPLSPPTSSGPLPLRCGISSRASCRAPSRSRRLSATTSTSDTTSSAPRFTACCGRSRCRWRCWCARRSTSRPARSALRTSAWHGWPDMDPRLLHYYNQELQYLRELGGEFAEEFPKVAARLGMSGIEVADPYVERLLEGVGFLAARVQLKLDAELPRFTHSLRSEEHTSELQSQSNLVCRLLLEKKKCTTTRNFTTLCYWLPDRVSLALQMPYFPTF